MNGFDFLPRRNASLFAFWEQRELRVPALAVAGAIVVVLLGMLVEQARLGQEHGLRERAEADVTLLDARVARFRRLEVQARDDHTLAATVLTLRHSAVTRASEIAEIGNRLAADAWLSGLQHDDGGWRVSGSATRLRDVSSTIMALRPLSPAQRLDSVTEQVGSNGSVRLHYQLLLAKRAP